MLTSTRVGLPFDLIFSARVLLLELQSHFETVTQGEIQPLAGTLCREQR
jgi:hypothetical protein